MNNIGEKPDTRERVLKYGIENASDKDLVMLLLGTGFRGYPVEKLANKVLEYIRCYQNNELLTQLMTIQGMGPGKAALICASLELGRRLSHTSILTIKKPVDVIPLVQHYVMESREHFISVSLNGAYEILNIRVVSIGTINKTLIHPREVFAEPLKERAAAVVLCHNHPSGNVKPSAADIDVTERLCMVADLLGVTLLDHIVLAGRNYFSFAEHKLVFGDACESSY